MKLKKIFIAFLGMIALHSFVYSKGVAPSKKELRSTTNINENWSYLENNTTVISEAQQASSWVAINLPHTWNSEDVVDAVPGYRRSASWYRKNISLQEVSEALLYQLYFEGSNSTTKVYINGKVAGTHIGGYIGFKIPITAFLKAGVNEILVRVDNSYNPEIIPSQKNDFFIYGGITRDVWLQTLPKTHIQSLEIQTPKVSSDNAIVVAEIQVQNDAHSSHLKIKGVLRSPNGTVVATKTEAFNGNLARLKFNKVSNPELWDTENPNLYELQVTLIENQEIKDTLSETIGFRWFEFKEHGPFYLNGKRLLLRGTHRHEETAGVGAAMSNAQHRRDMELIKEMGANFVRLAHYPQDPEIYKMCDKLGILVWDELPWSRGGIGNDNWKANTKRVLQKMIEQNRNHPSIIIWSLGNEIYWLPDFEDGDDPKRIKPFLNELNDLAHQLDPSRKTAIRKYYEGADIVDVFSPSIWSGWYSGSYKSYGKAIHKYKKEYAHFLHAEYGGSSQLGRHSENPITGEGVIQSDGWEEEIVQTEVKNIAQIGDWSENYIVDLFDWHLRISETDSTFVGNAQWAFKDFATPLRPENDIPYVNQKGLMDRAGNPKDAFYVFKSYWSKIPFVYIESHTWKERQGPEGGLRTISVFSNCKEVRLFLNGKDLGAKQKNSLKFPASGLHWEIPFKEGENSLKAVGITEDGTKVTDEMVVQYRFEKNGAPQRLQLDYVPMENGSYLVSATALDENGLRCLDYEEKVYFQCLEGGTLVENQGTPTGSSTISMSNGKASIEVIPFHKGTPLSMTVLNQNFKGTYLNIVN